MKKREIKPVKTIQNQLVRLERNIDSIPIWAPKSYSDEVERRYPLLWRGERAEVIALASSKYGQFRKLDKIVLTALVELWNQQGRRPDGIVVFQIMDVLELLGRKGSSTGGSTYEGIKESLYRLSTASLQFIHCFCDHDKRELRSTSTTHIIYELLIVEPRKAKRGEERDGFKQMTRARLNLDLVKNLLGNYTRPVSIRLLNQLSEKGVLFEQYINAVLWRRPRIRKDVFVLWKELGLATECYAYGCQIAAKMRKDLDQIAADPNSLLDGYKFTSSKTRSKSKNLVLYRKRRAVDMTLNEKIESGEDLNDIDILVEQIRTELQDKSPNDANIRAIATVMPAEVINRGIFVAWGRFRDGQIENPASYFVGIMVKKAVELGIDLGINRRRKGGVGERH